MNGLGLFLAVFASLLGGLFFLIAKTQGDGLIDGLAPVDQLKLGLVFLFLTGVIAGGTAVLAIDSWLEARRRSGRGGG